jgi:hypothetical protein
VFAEGLIFDPPTLQAARSSIPDLRSDLEELTGFISSSRRPQAIKIQWAEFSVSVLLTDSFMNETGEGSFGISCAANFSTD